MAHAQLRDSPGPRHKSTASMTCGTSKVGNGVSGSTSSSIALPFKKPEGDEGEGDDNPDSEDWE